MIYNRCDDEEQIRMEEEARRKLEVYNNQCMAAGVDCAFVVLVDDHSGSAVSTLHSLPLSPILRLNSSPHLPLLYLHYFIPLIEVVMQSSTRPQDRLHGSGKAGQGGLPAIHLL